MIIIKTRIVKNIKKTSIQKIKKLTQKNNKIYKNNYNICYIKLKKYSKKPKLKNWRNNNIILMIAQITITTPSKKHQP